MLTNRDETIDCIPQRAPFIAVHGIRSATEEAGHTCFEILPDSVFVTNGKISAAGLIENMAQTAAAQMGFICREKGLPAPLGYIASVKQLSIRFLPPVGAVLETVITITNRVMDVVFFCAVVHHDNALVCQCEMRVFIKAG